MLWITFAWGSCFLAISVGLTDAPLLWFAALRALIAGGALLAVAGFRREPTPRGARTWILIAVMGVVNVSVAFSAMFGGLAGLTTGAAAVLANAQPLLIMLPAWWIYKERISARTMAALGAGFVGLGTAAAFLGWFAEVRHCRLDAVSAWTFLVPVFGILLSIVVLGERQTFWSMAGMALVVASMLALVLPGRKGAVPDAGKAAGFTQTLRGHHERPRL